MRFPNLWFDTFKKLHIKKIKKTHFILDMQFQVTVKHNYTIKIERMYSSKI